MKSMVIATVPTFIILKLVYIKSEKDIDMMLVNLLKITTIMLIFATLLRVVLITIS